MQLSNRSAVVTGGGSGIGRATALRFAAEGAVVAVLDRNLEAATATADEIGNALPVACDVGDRDSVVAAFEAVEAELGEVHVLANIAGVNPAPGDASHLLFEAQAARVEEARLGQAPTTHLDYLIRMPDEGWLTMMNVHVNGTFYCTREALRIMARRNTAGSIVNCASIAALAGMGQTHYSAAKGAILGFTRGLAREVASRQIRVNVVCPGVTDTPMNDVLPDDVMARATAGIPLGRQGTSEELAAAFLFLASDESSYITGQSLSPNGGLFIG